jgi:type VI protein secretion system component Hcp
VDEEKSQKKENKTEAAAPPLVPDSQLDAVVGGGTADKVQQQDFSVSKVIDKASPTLFKS